MSLIDDDEPTPISFTVGLGAVKYLMSPRMPKNSVISSPPKLKLGNDLKISAILSSTAY